MATQLGRKTRNVGRLQLTRKLQIKTPRTGTGLELLKRKTNLSNMTEKTKVSKLFQE